MVAQVETFAFQAETKHLLDLMNQKMISDFEAKPCRM